jgi:hypothetical protein
MRGNGDFEAKSPASWELDFMKRWKHSDFFVGASVQAKDVDARHIGVQCTPFFGRLWPGMTPESGAI